MTSIDKIAASINVLYIVFLVFYVLTLLWFVFYKINPLIRFKEARDKLEHVKILKLLIDKKLATGENIYKFSRQTVQSRKQNFKTKNHDSTFLCFCHLAFEYCKCILARQCMSMRMVDPVECKGSQHHVVI